MGYSPHRRSSVPSPPGTCLSWFRVGRNRTTLTIGKRKVTYVSAEGTYKSGLPGAAQTPMPSYALMAAIIESGEGSVFVKMTGPKELTRSATPDFKKMVESALK